MKVAILTSALDETGGWGRYTVNLVEALTDKGVKCTVFSEDTARPERLISPVKALSSRPGSGIFNLFRIITDWVYLCVLARRQDLLHVTTETHIILASLTGRPYIISSHGTYVLRYFRRPITRWLIVRAFNKASAVIVTSEFTYEKISPFVKVRRTEQLPNGVDTKLFTRDKTVVREPRTLITVGGIKHRKGQDLVVKAVSELKKEFSDILYLLVGEAGSLSHPITEMIQEYGLEGKVIFAGTPDDKELVQLYSQAGVFVLPSRSDAVNSAEGYPLSLLEASACGIPIIGSYGCGAEHLIIPRKNGFLVHQEAVDELVGYLRELFLNPAEALKMGNEALKIVGSLSWERNAERVIGLYKSVLKHEI